MDNKIKMSSIMALGHKLLHNAAIRRMVTVLPTLIVIKNTKD